MALSHLPTLSSYRTHIHSHFHTLFHVRSLFSSLCPDDDDDFIRMRTKELNNGRLAMIGVIGIIAQELVTGQPLFA